MLYEVITKPKWIRVKAPTSQAYGDVVKMMRSKQMHTVCEEAACPNIGECWQRRHAAFMILGDTCTRACAFCNVKTGRPGLVDPTEPARITSYNVCYTKLLRLIGGFCHLYIGQEAVVTGLQSLAQDNDCIVTSYRDHGHMLASGMDPKGVMAELTGRSGGYSKGKGGSMHMFSREKNFFGGHGIVAAQVPIGTGLAFAQRYRGEDGVTFCYLGDGAVNQGQVYESFNMAALWKLPVIYVIENNKYGMGTSVERASSNVELFKRGQAYGIPGMQIDA